MRKIRRNMRKDKNLEKQVHALCDAARKDPGHPFRAQYVFGCLEKGVCPDCFAKVDWFETAEGGSLVVCPECEWECELGGPALTSKGLWSDENAN